MITPAGMAKLSDRRRNPGRYLLAFGRSARKKPECRWSARRSARAGAAGTGSEAKTPNSTARRRRTRLRQEQHRDALDVRRSPAAPRRRRPEGARICRRAARAGRRPWSPPTGLHGDADVGVLDRQGVVHAVAGHGDGWPRPAERSPSPSSARGSPARRPSASRAPPPARRGRRAASGVDAGIHLESHPARDRGDRVRAVARDHLHRTSCSAK